MDAATAPQVHDLIAAAFQRAAEAAERSVRVRAAATMACAEAENARRDALIVIERAQRARTAAALASGAYDRLGGREEPARLSRPLRS
jgi:hypothetical protein